MTDNQPNELDTIIPQLIALGEDRDELEYWQSIYNDLSPQQQQDLLENLQQELQQLEEKQ